MLAQFWLKKLKNKPLLNIISNTLLKKEKNILRIELISSSILIIPNVLWPTFSSFKISCNLSFSENALKFDLCDTCSLVQPDTETGHLQILIDCNKSNWIKPSHTCLSLEDHYLTLRNLAAVLLGHYGPNGPQTLWAFLRPISGAQRCTQAPWLAPLW